MLRRRKHPFAEYDPIRVHPIFWLPNHRQAIFARFWVHFSGRRFALKLEKKWKHWPELATVCFSEVLWGVNREGQQQFATQTIRVHLLGIDLGFQIYYVICSHVPFLLTSCQPKHPQKRKTNYRLTLTMGDNKDTYLKFSVVYSSARAKLPTQQNVEVFAAGRLVAPWLPSQQSILQAEQLFTGVTWMPVKRYITGKVLVEWFSPVLADPVKMIQSWKNCIAGKFRRGMSSCDLRGCCAGKIVLTIKYRNSLDRGRSRKTRFSSKFSGSGLKKL